MSEEAGTKEMTLVRWTKAILEWFFSRPSLLFAVAFVCFVLIALPQRLQKFLDCDEILKTFRGYISLVGIIAFALYIAWLLTKIAKQTIPWFERQLEEVKIKRHGHKTLVRLTPQEKEYVAKYIAEDKTSMAWPLEDGVIQILAQQAVVIQASNIGRLMSGVEYAIQPWVRKVLEKHNDLKQEILKHYRPEGTIV